MLELSQIFYLEHIQDMYDLQFSLLTMVYSLKFQEEY